MALTNSQYDQIMRAYEAKQRTSRLHLEEKKTAIYAAVPALKELEEQIRLWARENGAVLIATGPVIPDEALNRLGKNRVGVPRQFYKVLCMVVNNQLEGVGFLFENRDYGTTPLRQMMVPIDSVEQVTGIDFFPALPDDEERQMEATVHTDLWSF